MTTETQTSDPKSADTAKDTAKTKRAPRKVTDIATKRNKDTDTAADIAISETHKVELLEVAGAWQSRSDNLDTATWELAYKVREIFLASAQSSKAFVAIARIIQPVAPDLVTRGEDTAEYNRQYASRLSTYNATAARWPRGGTMPNTSFTAHSAMVGNTNRIQTDKEREKVQATVIQAATKKGGLTKSEAAKEFEKAVSRHKVTLKAQRGAPKKATNANGRNDSPTTEGDPMWLATEIHRLANLLVGVVNVGGGRHVDDNVAVAHLIPAIETLGSVVSADQRKAAKAS